MNFNDLIEALSIFNHYVDGHAGLHCEHDELTVCGVDPRDVTDEDKNRLAHLGFFVDGTEDCFRSIRWGSC